MRIEISYPGGTTHEVDLPARLCVVGRDPSCDVVLNDAKCSRKHAVLEQSAGGLIIRDAGSANGIYVNGKRVEQAPLSPGDSVRLGEVKLRLLPELGEVDGEVSETIVVHSESLDLGGPVELGDSGSYSPALGSSLTPPLGQVPFRPEAPPQPPPAPPAPAPAAARQGQPAARAGALRPPSSRPAPRSRPARGAGGPARPPTVSLLAGLWALFVPLAVAGAFLAAARLQAGWLGWLAAAMLAVVCAGLGTTMALGLRALAPWARHLQVATAALGLLVCPFTLAAATVLFYMSRSEVKAVFEGAAAGPGADAAEPTFAISLVGMLLLGLALTAIAVLLL
jgi:pSer/pThr/pTyr-binding forkhead associated (FHA) protein